MFIFLQQKNQVQLYLQLFFRQQLTDSQLIGQSYRRHTNNTILHLDREKSIITSTASQHSKKYQFFRSTVNSTKYSFMNEPSFLYTLFTQTHMQQVSLFFSFNTINIPVL